ncbi:MAG: hypothetical protein WAL56_06315 [Candidatus Sulfotelmatobacter sp.]
MPEEIRIPARATNDPVPVANPPTTPRGTPRTPVSTSTAPIAPFAPPATPVSTKSIVDPIAAPRADISPVVYGPSFLGLNRPPDSRSGDGLQGNAGSGYDAHRSGNLDYLLEEEEPKRGWGKLLVVVIALGLIGGFGYLRWKQGGFNFLKPAAATHSAENAPDSASAPSATPAAPSGDSSSAASQNSAAGNPANPATTAATTSTPDSAANGTATSSPAGNNASAGTDAGAQPAASASSGTSPTASAPQDNSSTGKPQENSAAEKSSEADSAEDAGAGPAKAESRAAPSSAAPAAAKPSAARTRERKPTPATPVDTTAEAERYIYGRGVPQDCDVGLRMLKPAAQANPKAMITLGTLYSSGTCTPRDLPTAYRWFAMALHKQPDNQTLQDDLHQLWSQMTPPERQLAIKLSQ